MENFDLFISYAHADGEAVAALVAALQGQGLQVFQDLQIPDFESITTTISSALGRCKALLAYYSRTYPTRRSCQWELTAAFIAGQYEGDPRRRVLVINPESGVDHLYPLELRDALFPASPPPGACSVDDFVELAKRIADRTRTLDHPIGDVRPLAAPPWYGIRGLGSNRFVGRMSTLWELHSALIERDVGLITGAVAPGLVQVRGMGGIGKSLLAEEYALRFGAAYPGGVFALTGSRGLDEQIANFAGALGVVVEGVDAAQIARRLAALLTNDEPYLWLVDDLPADLDETARRRWLAPTGAGKTLITTRSRKHSRTGRVLDLDVLDPTEAYELLTKSRQPMDASEEAAARAIVEALGCHALAIDVAGAAITALDGQVSFAGFLDELRSPDSDALESAVNELLAHEQLPNGHQKSIAATLLRSVGSLDEPGRDLLRLASLLAGEVIPFDVVTAVMKGLGHAGSWVAASAASGLVHLCLAETAGCSGAPTANEAPIGYRVHALVRRTMHFRDPDPGRRSQIRAVAVAALHQILPQVPDFRAHREFAVHIAHARHLVAEPKTRDETALLAWVGRHDQARGALASAQAIRERVVTASGRLWGANHRTTLKARSNLAQTLRALGDLKRARALEQAVLDARIRELGKEDPDTLTSKNNLGEILLAQGDPAGARGLLEATLGACLRVLGEEHPDTLATRGNLATTLEAQGYRADARAQEEAVLEIRIRTQGEEHPDTLTSMNNLAQTLKAQGRFDDARALGEKVVEGRTRVFGDEHPATLTARNNLAQTLLHAGDLEGARRTLEAVLEAFVRVLGPDHPITLATRNNVGVTLYQLGDLEGAREIFEAVLDVSVRVVGPDHPITLATRRSLAKARRP